MFFVDGFWVGWEGRKRYVGAWVRGRSLSKIEPRRNFNKASAPNAPFRFRGMDPLISQNLGIRYSLELLFISPSVENTIP